MRGRQLPELERYLENLGAMRILYRTSRRYRPSSENDLRWQRWAIEKLFDKVDKDSWLFVLPEAAAERDQADVFHFPRKEIEYGMSGIILRLGFEHYILRVPIAGPTFMPAVPMESILLPYGNSQRVFLLNPYYDIKHIATVQAEEKLERVLA